MSLNFSIRPTLITCPYPVPIKKKKHAISQEWNCSLLFFFIVSLFIIYTQHFILYNVQIPLVTLLKFITLLKFTTIFLLKCEVLRLFLPNLPFIALIKSNINRFWYVQLESGTAFSLFFLFIRSSSYYL